MMNEGRKKIEEFGKQNQKKHKREILDRQKRIKEKKT